MPLGPIQCPTLIIAARQDGLRQAEEAHELCMQFPGAQLEVIEGSGHMVPLEQPETLGRLMSQWLATTAVTKQWCQLTSCLQPEMVCHLSDFDGATALGR